AARCSTSSDGFARAARDLHGGRLPTESARSARRPAASRPHAGADRRYRAVPAGARGGTGGRSGAVGGIAGAAAGARTETGAGVPAPAARAAGSTHRGAHRTARHGEADSRDRSVPFRRAAPERSTEPAAAASGRLPDGEDRPDAAAQRALRTDRAPHPRDAGGRLGG